MNSVSHIDDRYLFTKVSPKSQNDGFMFTKIPSRQYENCKSFKKKNIYIRCMKPAIIPLKLLGVLPLQADYESFVDWCPLSWIMLYSLMVYILVAALIGCFIYGSVSILLQQPTEKFSKKVEYADWIISGILVITLPIINLIEIRGYVVYLRQWMLFEAKYENISKSSLIKLTYRRSVIALSIILVFQVIAQTFNYILTKKENYSYWLSVPTIMFFFIFQHVWVLFWYLSCYALSLFVDIIAENWKQDENISVSHERLFILYRSLWMDVIHLVRQMGTAYPYTYKILILYWFITLTTVVYSLLVTGFDLGLTNFYNSILVLNNTIILYLICSSADNLTTKIRREIGSQISRLQHTFEANTYREKMIQGLLLHVQAYPPEINLSGYIIINRRLLVTLAAALVTYMVVLVQMDMSDVPNNNSTESSSNTK